MSYERLLDRSLQQSVLQAVESFEQLQLQEQNLPLEKILARAFTFPHTSTPSEPFRIAASDGSGSFPLVQRDTIFFYLATADAVGYQAESGINPLNRYGKDERISEMIVWAEHWDDSQKEALLDSYYQKLTGKGFRAIAAESDYLSLKHQQTKRRTPSSVDKLKPIIYSASETDSVRKLLMGSAELAVALKTLYWDEPPQILLLDGTLSLLSLSSRATILTDLLKRHLLYVARERGVTTIALSKSATFVGATEITRTLTEHFKDTHWAYRFPLPDEESLGIEGLYLPPPGAVTYLVRFHREAPGLRLDFDRHYWESMGRDEWVRELLPLLDFSSHEARCYGYPYPLFAAHVRCSLNREARRVAKSMLLSSLRNAGFDAAEFEEIHSVLGMGEW